MVNMMCNLPREYSPDRTLNGIHVLQQVTCGLGLAKKNEEQERCTTAQKISREMAQLLSIAIYQLCIHLLFWGCAVFNTNQISTLSVCFDQAAATAGWQRHAFFDLITCWPINLSSLNICVLPQFEISWPVWSQKKIRYMDIILLCERSQARFGSKIRSLFLPSVLWTVSFSDFSNMNIVPGLSSVPQSGKWPWFVQNCLRPMFHFY